MEDDEESDRTSGRRVRSGDWDVPRKKGKSGREMREDSGLFFGTRERED